MNQRATFLLIAILFLLQSGIAQAAADPQLLAIAKHDTGTESRIVLDFLSPPTYRVESSGQRLDLFLADTTLAPDFANLQSDQQLAEVKIEERSFGINLTLLFRQPVSTVESSFPLISTPPSGDQGPPAQLVLLLGWPKQSQPAPVIPAIATTMQGGPALQMGAVAVSRRISSKYTGNWQRFFVDYEHPLSIPVPIRYSLPDFPVFTTASKPGNRSLPEGLSELAGSGNWPQITEKIQQLLSASPTTTDLPVLELMLADSLARQGRYPETVATIDKLLANTTDPKISRCAALIMSFAMASDGNPYGAEIKLTGLPADTSFNDPLQPYINIMKAEIAMATARQDDASLVLADAKLFQNGPARDLRLLRQADNWFYTGQPVKALAAYRQLASSGNLLQNNASSLAAYAESLFRQESFQEANELYNRITPLLTDANGRSLAVFREIIAQFHSGSTPDQIRTQLEQLMQEYPGTEGYFRARLKRNDLAFSDNGIEADKLAAINDYGEIAATANVRELREEAAFKQALAMYFIKDEQRTVQLLNKFLHNYTNSSLHPEAQALQLEIMPNVVRNLIDQGKYLDSLVLAEQNRDLLLSGQLSGDFLSELGVAFAGLLLYSRAARVYRFMLAAAGTRDDEEKQYLPLIDNLYQAGEYDQAKRYANQYLDAFPVGKNRPLVLRLLLDSLRKEGRLEAAVVRLGDGNIPDDPAVHEAAGRIFFELNRYPEAARYLAKAISKDLEKSDPQLIFLQAEALFLSANGEKAYPLYQHLESVGSYRDQALYRMAQLQLTKKDTSTGINILQRLVDEGVNPLWKRMAAETLALQAL